MKEDVVTSLWEMVRSVLIPVLEIVGGNADRSAALPNSPVYVNFFLEELIPFFTVSVRVVRVFLPVADVLAAGVVWIFQVS